MAMLEQDSDGFSEPVFTLGDRLRKARDHAGIKSAQEMAELLGHRFGVTISKNTVNAWERETNQPTRPVRLPDVVRAYSEICRVPERWLWEHSGYDAPLSLVSGIEGPIQTALNFDPPVLVGAVPA